MSNSSSRLRIAITGGIAEGKSTVVGFLSDLGMSVWSADDVVRQLWASEEFMEQAFAAAELPQGLSRAEVRQKLVDDHHVRRAINSVFHPVVASSMQESDAEIFEVPLLIESCLHRWFKHVWVVTCGEDEQVRRLTERVVDEAEARKLMGTQLPTRAKIPFADEVIRTNTSLENVLDSVKRALRHTLEKI